MNYIIKRILLLFILTGCATPYEVSLDKFLAEKSLFEKRNIIILTDIAHANKRWRLLKGKKIKIKGYPVYFGFRGFPFWNFILKDKKGNSIRCYERNYRVEVWILPDMVVKEAEKGNKKITVVGRVKRKGIIELDCIEYDGQVIDTDQLPAALRKFF